MNSGKRRTRARATIAVVAAASLSSPFAAAAAAARPLALVPPSSSSFGRNRFPLPLPTATTTTPGPGSPRIPPPIATTLPARFVRVHRRRRHSSVPRFALLAADDDGMASDADEDAGRGGGKEEGTTSNDKIDTPPAEAPEPPPFLALGYSVAACMNLMAAVILICNVGSVGAIDGVATTAATTASVPFSPPVADATAAATTGAASVVSAARTTAATTARYRPDLIPTYLAGALGHLLLAGGTCDILAGAARTKRLYTSGTYKRLTMGTLMFGLIGLFSLPGEAGCVASSPAIVGGAFLATQLAKFATAFVSFLGWEYGAGGFGSSSIQRIKNVLKEIGGGCRRAWRTMPVSEERPATFYRTFLVFVTIGNFAFNVPELVFNLRQGAGLVSLKASLNVSSVARLGLLSVLLYVLKDAAERKRLEGTTFVKLNLMVGLWALAVGIAQGFADGPTGPFSIRRAADKLIFGILFLNNGILSLLSRAGIIERRDGDKDPDAAPVILM